MVDVAQWLADEKPHFVPDPESPTGGPRDLLPHVKKAFNAKKTCAYCMRVQQSCTAFDVNVF